MIPLFVGLFVAVLQVVVPLVAGDALSGKDAGTAAGAVVAGGAGTAVQRRRGKAK